MDGDHEGCPPFVVTENNVIVKELVLQDQHVTVKQLTVETGNSIKLN